MLAIVIPYYKLTFFEATLKSLVSQTNRQFKVYIGNDASPEDPSILLEKYNGKFDFVYHRFDENLGSVSLVKQWKRCIANTNDEEWIMILGDDDVLGENVVAAFYESLYEIKEERISVIRYPTFKINELGNQTSCIYQHPKIESSIDFLFRKTRSSLSEYIFKRSQISNIGFKDFPLAWFSDVLAILEFSDFKDIYTINSASVYVRVSTLSISGNQNNLKLKAKAKFEFYYYLLSKKRAFFSEIQKEELLARISKCYINDKRQLQYFYKISGLFLEDFSVLNYCRFIKSILYYTFKKKPKEAKINRIPLF
jgi:hypothetical protein